MPRIFDNIVCNKISLLTKNIIINEQHGFKAGRSTITNLAVYHNFILSVIEAGSQIDVIYTDFRKAFDSVNHSILINKLSALGFCGNLLLWLRSYLTDRTQIVKYKHNFSRGFPVLFGVP